MGLTDQFFKRYHQLRGQSSAAATRPEVTTDEIFPPDELSLKAARKAAGKADPLLATMLLDMWHQFFATFRDDERQFEWQQFREEASAVQQAIDQLGPGALPDALLCRQMMFLLKRFSAARNDSRDDRFDDVTDHCNTLRADLQAQKMTSSWMSDEMNRCRNMIIQALQGREYFIAHRDDKTLSELIAALLGVNAPPNIPRAVAGRRSSGEQVETAENSGHYRIASEILRPKEQDDSSDLAIVRAALGELLNEGITVAKLRRALEDAALAKALVDLTTTFRRQRSILKRVGLLASSEVPEDEVRSENEEAARSS